MTALAPPNTVLMAARHLARELVTGHDDPDPHDLVADLLTALTRPQRRALLDWAAGELLREAVRLARADARPAGRSWKSAVTTSDLLAQRFYVAGAWRELGSLTREEVLAVAADYHERAERNAARAAEFERLAAVMEATGAATVAAVYAERKAA